MKTTTRCKKAILRSFRKIDGVALLAIMAIGMPAFAADLTLVGNGDKTALWDNSSNTKVWTNSVGTSVAFSKGDNVLISSQYFTGDTVKINASVKPGDVEVYADRSLKLTTGSNSGYGLNVDTKSFTKRGPGTLLMDCGASGASGPIDKGNAMTCGVDIVEGEIACAKANTHNLLGPREEPFWVYVRNGAALSFLERNQTGSPGMPECGIKIQLDEGGTLNHCTNKVSETKEGGNIATLSVNTLKLNGGDIVIGAKAYGKDDNTLGGKCWMKIFNTLWFSGHTPHAFGFNDCEFEGFKTYTPSGTLKGYMVSLNPYSPVEFRVDEIAEGIDAYANMLSFTCGTNAVGKYRCDIVKTGDGTLCFPSNNCTKPFIGDFTVKEGNVVFKSLSNQQWFFGATAADPQQTITVSTNGTMIVNKRNITTPADENTPNIKIVVDHGKLVYDTSEADAGALTAKDWVFDDAELEIHNKGFNRYIGVLVFRNSVTFRGSKPLVMWPDENLDTTWQAVNVYNGYRTMNYGTENGPVTTFDVADMTGDGRTDVVMGYHIWNGVTNMNQNSVFTDSGFIKKGLGTFSVASAANKVTGPVTVSQGTLRIDGTLVTPSSVSVSSGAFIGGTGTVARVSIAPGAGLAALAGQDTPLTVEGDLVLPATGTVNISNLDGLAADNLPASKLVTVTGTLSGAANLANWTVTIDGVPASSYEVAISGNIVRVSKKCGLTITFW